MKSGKYPLSELANRIIEDRRNFLNISSTKINTPILKQPHQDGDILEGYHGSQMYWTIIYPNFKIQARPERLRQRFTHRDDCIILPHDKVFVVINILSKNDDIYFVGYYFKNVTDYYLTPCASSKVGIYLCDTYGSIEVIHLSEQNTPKKAAIIPALNQNTNQYLHRFFTTS